MKRNTKPFSVEIKKSRVQGQRHHLQPRRLFESTPVEATKTFQKGEAPVAGEPPPAARILPSIVKPVWSSAEPADLDHRKLSLGKANREQMKSGLKVASSEALAKAHSAVPMIAEPLSHAEIATAEEAMTPINDANPAQGESAKPKGQKARQRKPRVIEQVTPCEPALRLERTPEAEIREVSVLPPPYTTQRRQKKRLAEAAQLQRSERWKRRLHPASW